MPTLLDQAEATELNWSDLLYAVADPAGTPGDRKITKENLFEATLKALAGLSPASGKMARFTGAASAELVEATAAGLALLGAASAAAQRAALGVTPGVDVQALDGELSAIAGLASAADTFPYFTGSGAAALAGLTSFSRASCLTQADAGGWRGALRAMQRIAWSDIATDSLIQTEAGANVDCSGGNRIIQLNSTPDTLGLVAVRMAVGSGTNKVTITPTGGWTIDGAATLDLFVVGDFVILQALASGNKWRLLGDFRQPHVALMKLATATAIANATTTKAPFDATSWDVGGIADLANDQMVVRRAGKYRYTVRAWLANWGTYSNMSVYVNGSLVDYDNLGLSAAFEASRGFSGTLDLAAGDTVDFRIYQNSGGSQNTSAAAHLRCLLSLKEVR